MRRILDIAALIIMLVAKRNVKATFDEEVSTTELQMNERAFLWNLYRTFGLLSNDDLDASFSSNSTMANVCSWKGLVCNDKGLVIHLDLSSRVASTTITRPSGSVVQLPSDWRPLSHLERLLLRNNHLGGPLPTHLPSTLIHFNVDRNQFDGQIPYQWTELALVERLILSGNGLGGGLYSTVLCSMLQLKALNVAGNEAMSGQLPACLASLPQLNSLEVDGTNLLGPMPQELLARCDATEINKDGDHEEESVTQEDQQALPSTKGYCERFGFCLDGYRQLAYEMDGDTITSTTAHEICELCPDLSNRLGSSTCEWIGQPSFPSPLTQTPYPTKSPTTVATSYPTVRPVSATLAPSMTLSTSPTVSTATATPSTNTTFFTSSPSFSPSLLPLLGSSMAPSNSEEDRVPSAIPSMTIPIEDAPSPSPVPVDGIQEQPQGPDEDLSRTTRRGSFWDGPVLVPLFVMLSVASVVSWLVILPIALIWFSQKDRQGDEGRSSFSTTTSDTVYHPQDLMSDINEPKAVSGPFDGSDDNQDEIIFSNQEIIDDLEHLMTESSLGPLFSDYEANYGLSSDRNPARRQNSLSKRNPRMPQTQRPDPPRILRTNSDIKPQTKTRKSKVRFLLEPVTSGRDSTIEDISPSGSALLSHDDPYEGVVLLGNSSSISSISSGYLNPLENPVTKTATPPSSSRASARKSKKERLCHPLCFRPPVHSKNRTTNRRHRRDDELPSFLCFDIGPSLLGIRSPFFDMEQDRGDNDKTAGYEV